MNSFLSSIRWFLPALCVGLVLGGQESTARAQSAPKMADENDLIVGPLDALIKVNTGSGWVEKKVQLQFLTKQQLVYRDYVNPGPMQTVNIKNMIATGENKPSNKHIVRLIETRDPEGRWTWDDAQNEFTGPVIAPLETSLAESRRDRRALELYYVVAAESVLVSLENAITSQNRKRFDSILGYCEQVTRQGRALQVPDATLRLLDLKVFAERLHRDHADILAIQKELLQIKADTQRDLRAIQTQYEQQVAMSVLFGFTGMVLGSSNNNFDQQVGGELVGNAASEFIQATGNRLQSELTIKSNEVRLESESLERLKKSMAAYDATKQKQLDAIGSSWERLGLNRRSLARLDTLINDLTSSRDVGAAIQALDIRHQILAKEGIVDPLSLSSLMELKSRLLLMVPSNASDRARRADELMDLAQQAYQAAREKIPPYDAFHSDRVVLLAVAGQLIYQAVNYSHQGEAEGPKRWVEFYDTRADQGIRILNEALIDKGLDPSGRLRATRAWLYMQRGLPEKALVAAQEVESLLKYDPEAQYNLAKVYAQAGKYDQANACFLQAIKAGYADLEAANRDEDMAFIKSNKYWQEEFRRQPKLTVTGYQANRSSGTYTLEIKNTGELPLVGAKIGFDTLINRKRESVGSTNVEYLAPGSTYYWVDAFKSTGIQVVRSGLQQTLLGRVVVETPHIKDGARPKALQYPVVIGTYTPYSFWWR